MTTSEFTPSSWGRASRPFDEVAGSVSSRIQSVVTSSTDATAIGSASGISLFDTAVTGVLAGLGQVMGEMATSLQQGLDSEATALAQTGQAYANVEDNNTVRG
ncbi:hypothetical protein ACQB6R_00740 [Propionibacteriaceae bacterium G1746]